MKPRILLLISAVALVTLSFTFTNVDHTDNQVANSQITGTSTEPVGGIIADEVVK